MHCQFCGAEVSEGEQFCRSCGGQHNRPNQSSSSNQVGVGYSQKINHPRVKEEMKKIRKSGMVFTVILAIVAVIGFTVAGAAEVGGFENPSAALIGLGFGGLLILIGVIQLIRAKADRTWDGVVTDKKVIKPSYSNRQQGNYQTRYFLFVHRDDDKIIKIPSTEALLDYYQIGDQVRHHAGTAIHILEKYDKSRDNIIYCVVCTSKNDINNEVCYRCKCPLLI